MPSSATPSATPVPEVRVLLGSVSGAPGETLPLQVRLESTAAVSSISIVFDFAAMVPVVPEGDGSPQCASSLSADEIEFAFLPDGCDPQVDCEGLEAMILGTDEPIADGAVIFTCMVRIADDAEAGVFPVPCISAIAMGPPEFDTEAGCVSGSVEVLAVATPSPTASTPVPPTEGPSPTATRRLGSEEDDGCQIASAPEAGALWLLVLPALLAFRRRRSAGRRTR